MNKRKLAPLALALPLSVLAAAPAYAQDDSFTLQGSFGELNESGGSGQTFIEVSGDDVTVTVQASGLADAAHAQHIHIGGEFECPPASSAEKNEPTEVLSTPEAQPSYGPIQISLTTEGDFSPESALAVDRMPSGSSYEYERTFENVSSDIIQSLSEGNAVIVTHGIAPVDGVDAQSPLNEQLPLNATAPAACAELDLAPEGGMQTGNGGGADEGVNYGLVGLGGAFVAAAGVGVYASRRLRSNQ